ncbi:hypothetical protein [Nonomuraea sp. NPDC049709]|uniref:hypothetical protein n=1 Tax=Nonomuraea sp. NPDC049709 TaxID=3154736 RepID=UPI003431FB80
MSHNRKGDPAPADAHPRTGRPGDGGGKVNAARRPVHGAEQVARFVLGLMGKAGPGHVLTPVAVNGVLGVAGHVHGRLDTVVSFTVAGGLVHRIDFVRAPDKLRLRLCHSEK